MNFFITNREIIKQNGKETIRENGREHAGDNLRFGTYDLIKKEFNLFPEPANLPETLYDNLNIKKTVNLKGSALFFKTLYDELSKPGKPLKAGEIEKGDVLFFIHGFNTDLQGVRDDFARLHKKYVENPDSTVKHIMIFTWPGRSPLIPLHYFDDKKDAIRSGEALARGFEKVTAFFKEFFLKDRNPLCNRNIHLMAHSMGNRVLKHVLLELDKKGIAKPELFSEIISIAADIEYTIFEKGEAYHSLIDLGKRVHVYYHNNDRVLDISAFTKNFTNRLGKHGRKSIDPTLEDVFDVNATKTKDDPEYNFKTDAFNHWYYYSSKQVVNDIINVFKGGRTKLG